MKITKQSSSLVQGVSFSTIRDIEEYIVITYPIGMSIEIKGNFIHVRPISDKPKASPSDVQEEVEE